MSTSYLDQIMARSNVVRAIATHYGLDYEIALGVAEAHRRKAAGEQNDYWIDKALEDAKGLGSAHAGFRSLLQTVMIRRFGEGARLIDE